MITCLWSDSEDTPKMPIFQWFHALNSQKKSLKCQKFCAKLTFMVHFVEDKVQVFSCGLYFDSAKQNGEFNTAQTPVLVNVQQVEGLRNFLIESLNFCLKYFFNKYGIKKSKF